MPQNVVRHESEHLYAAQPYSAAGQRLSTAILRLHDAERRQSDRALRASGLSSLDLSALRYLVQGAREHRDLGPKDLIGMLDTSSATVTNVVERLAGDLRLQRPAGDRQLAGGRDRVGHPDHRRPSPQAGHAVVSRIRCRVPCGPAAAS